MGDVPKPPVPDIVIEILGGEWPEGSETAMNALADVWDAAADDIDEIREDAATALDALIKNIEGESKEPMRTSMDELIESDQGLKAQAADYRALAELCRGYAGDLEKTKWIINVAMVEAVVSLGLTFFGPFGMAAAAAKMAAKKIAIKAAIKAAVSKIASEGASTSLAAAAKRAPVVAAREITQQAVTEAAVDQAGRRIAAMDGSTSTSLSESGGALRDGAIYGAGGFAARRGMGRGTTRAGRVARNAGGGVAGTTAVSVSHGEVPDAKDLAIGATEGVMGGNHHGSGDPGAGADGIANPAGAPGVDGGTPSVSTPGADGTTSTTVPGGDPGGPGPGQTVTPGDPGASGPGPVAGESASPVGDGAPPAGAESHTAGDAGAPTAGEPGAQGDAGGRDDAGGQGDTGGHGDAGGQGDTGGHGDAGSQSDGGGQGDAGSHSGAGAESTAGSESTAAGADSPGAGAESTSATTGSETSGAPPTHEMPSSDHLSGLDLGAPGGESSSATGSNISDAAGLSGESGTTAAGDPGSEIGTSPDGGPAGDQNATNSGNTAATGGEQSGHDQGGVAAAPPATASAANAAGAGASGGGSSSSSTKGPDVSGHTGADGDTGTGDAGSEHGADPTPGGETVTPPDTDARSSAPTTDASADTPTERGDVGISAADAPGTSTDPGRSPDGLPAADQHHSTVTPAAQADGAAIDGDTRVGVESGIPETDHLSGLDLDGGTIGAASAVPTGGPTGTPPVGTPTGTSAGGQTGTPTATSVGSTGGSTTQSSNSAASRGPDTTDGTATGKSTDPHGPTAIADSTDTSRRPTEGLPAADSTDAESPSPEAPITEPTSDAAEGGEPGDSDVTPTAPEDGGTTDGGVGDAESTRPATLKDPDSVDTTDCAHNALDALSDRHTGLQMDRSPVGHRGDGPVPAGKLYDATGLTPDLNPKPADGPPRGPEDTPAAYDAVEARLRELGDGSTALVTSDWTAGTHTGGHTYLAHNDGGQITFTDPTSGESHPWPPTYSDVGNVAAGYVNPDGTPAHGNSTAENVSSTIGDVDANKEPATYTDWEPGDRRAFHSDFDAPKHTHPDGAIAHETTQTRTATLPTGETVTIEERRTTYVPGHPTDQDPAPREGEQVTITTTSVSAGDDPAGRNTVTWTEHGGRTVNAEINLRHSFEGMGRTSDETGHQRGVSSRGNDGTNVHGAVTGDHAGHIAAHRFMLDQGLKNLFPQNGNFNTSAYKMMENEWAALVRDGLEVDGTIAFEFDSPSVRPTSIGVEFVGREPDGDIAFIQEDSAKFLNTSGQFYEREYGK